jgi:uncharacterized cupredoxin-like copper-binding protein
MAQTGSAFDGHEPSNRHVGDAQEARPPTGPQGEPGETRKMTWTFTTPGEVRYGYHEPGHYRAGWWGRIAVTE